MIKIMHKKAEKFGFGLFIVAAAMLVSVFAFMTESNIAGFAVHENADSQEHDLIEFNDVNSLSILSAGSYFIDSNGIVYWTDDELTPPIGKIKNLDELQKSRHIYIDAQGNIGYILEYAVIEENE